MTNMTASLLAGVELAPRDPILGLTEQYNADKNPRKVNLGIGVYTDDKGKVPLLECVRSAETQLLAQAAPHSYLPIDGLPAYDKAVQALVFGAEMPAVKEGRIITVQALGGTGGLKIGADFLRRVAPKADVWISDPSWENHRALFGDAGFKVHTYPYYDASTHGVDFDAMLSGLRKIPAGSIVVMHACCHNPTGVDLTADQWTSVREVVGSRGLVPFLDIAYQGFGEGIDLDGAAVRRFAQAGLPVFVSNSFSKSFSLYGERVGALSVVTQSGDEGVRVLSQIKRLVRTNYSNPPSHGGHVIAKILTRLTCGPFGKRSLARCATAFVPCAPCLSRKSTRGCPAPTSVSSCSRKACFPIPGSPSSRSCACARSSGCMPWRAAGSAWRR